MKWTVRLLVDWLLIISTVTICSYYPILVIPGLFIIGSRLQALSIIGHMACHNFCSKSKLHNKIMQYLAFYPLGVDPIRYKKFHFAHHRWLGDPQRDPEVILQTEVKDRWLQHRKKDLYLDLVGAHYDEILQIFQYIGTWQSVFCTLIIQVLLVIFISPYWLMWLVATLTTFMFIFRLRAWTEHDHLNRPGITIKTSKPSVLKRMLYLPHNTWLHYEHHAGQQYV